MPNQSEVNRTTTSPLLPLSAHANDLQLAPGDGTPSRSDLTLHATDTQPFRLFDLPDELWVRIGKMVVQDTKAIKVGRITLCSGKKGCDAGHETGEWLIPSCELTPPAILQTCSWLRNEFRGDYYRDKVAVRVIWDFGWDSGRSVDLYSLLGRYLRMIGPEARRQIQGTMSDDVWLTPKASTPEPQWCRYADWEIEIMLEGQRTAQPSDLRVNPADEMWYKIKFI